MSITIRARAVLLDMDGTLVDSSRVIERIWGQWAAKHALDPAAVLQVVHGRQGQQSMRILLPGRSHEENLADSRAMADRETQDVAGIRAIPGARGLLDSLTDLPHALVTSATVPLASARMAAAGLPLPGIVVTAEAVSASKPSPEGFLTAAARLEVPAEACVVFEDSEAGVAAARSAGMRVVQVGTSTACHHADWTIPDLFGVRAAACGEGLRIMLVTS